jgi:ankyrin repeat protein
MSSFPWPGNSPREWNETIDKLISEDQPDVLNEKGQTPLWLVATYGFPGCVQKLVTTDKVNVNFQDELGRTPLYQASKSGHIDVVRVLLKHNADPNIWRNNGLAPIYQAVKNDHIQVVELLLDHKCQIPVQGHISIWRVAEGHTRDWLLQKIYRPRGEGEHEETAP